MHLKLVLAPMSQEAISQVCLRMQGVLRMGQEIEVRPGIVTKDAEGRVQCMPIYSRIVSLLAESNVLQYAVPGGLIGVGTTVSPFAAATCPSLLSMGEHRKETA